MSESHLASLPTRRTGTAILKRSLLLAVAYLLAVSCENDSKKILGPSQERFAHIPSFSTSTTSSSGATFNSDKDDYLPGETVHLLGTAWPAGDVLDIHLDETPQNHPPVDWTVA